MDKELLFNKVQYLVFDVDGVFTDNKILVTEDGHFLRSFNMRDGYAVKKAISAGFKIAIITGGSSTGVEKRFKGLGVDLIFSGVQSKGQVFRNLIRQENWRVSEVLYMGDDEPDIDCLTMAGISVCPADAIPEVQSICDFVTLGKGGENCVRELIERILHEQKL